MIYWLTIAIGYTTTFQSTGLIHNLARIKSYDNLVHLFLTASIPRVIDFYGFRTAWQAVCRTIRYQYYDRINNKEQQVEIIATAAEYIFGYMDLSNAPEQIYTAFY